MPAPADRTVRPHSPGPDGPSPGGGPRPSPLATDADWALARAAWNEGRGEAALEALQAAARRHPANPELLVLKAELLDHLGRPLVALASLDQAIGLDPACMPALFHKAVLMNRLGDARTSARAWQAMTEVPPRDARAWALRGTAGLQLGRTPEALDAFDHALSLDARLVGAWHGRAKALFRDGRLDEADEALARACALAPGDPTLAWERAIACLPAIQMPHHDLPALRRRASAILAGLLTDARAQAHGRAWEQVGGVQLFHLAYQEEDALDLIRLHGQLCQALMARWPGASAPPLPARTRAGDRIRVGIVSPSIHDHSVWLAITQGLVTRLDPARFEVHLFHTGWKRDAETARAREAAASYRHGLTSLQAWADAIRDVGIEALIYPEIGVEDPITLQLASLRLAPVQIASWGHPISTGLPTIDHYLSAEAFETPDAASRYTEHLVALPGLGTCYPRTGTAPTPGQRQRLGLPMDRPVFVCPGVPFKYTPAFDRLLTRIARALPGCVFTFFEYRLGTPPALRRRMHDAFVQAGVDPAAIRFVPWQSRADFLGLLAACDAYLDSTGFSGFNTAMLGVESGIPIVTRRGRAMRANFASAILTELGLPELVADSDEDYVRIAVRLGRDPPWRRALRRRIGQQGPSLFGRTEAIHALEDWLATVCRDPPPFNA